MGNIIDDVMGHITPIDKKEVDEFKLLVSEEAFLTENRDKITFSEGFPPELAGAISGLGAGAVGIGVVFAAFAGMSGAEIMAALAGFGVTGAVGGIVSVAAVVTAPVALIGGGVYHIANQNKLGRELERLFKESIKFEEQLAGDDRENVKGLIIATKEYRSKLANKHHDLKKLL
ncbi:hypothetical protein F1F79_16235 [Listeria monocytogenes]|jgi:hypothetical protein|uniref:Uncharacterized protein n=1 Tax=Listeria monocytogenes TaxID=1639 RepID=A0AAD2RD71_LISMN|nr:hypothetical protein [Listeria monocytogenes]EAA0073335.1 hypothetical protein [Listeria monocytogenes]EAA0387436.1 hypothetical protein [Listeria monocytogenes]EAC4738767.1 hypothetical protein [Listeria monocytogenes]EAC6098652.1 hypothetical protein [Listeria monocytogenes]